jgi:hypothetical protein
LKRELAWGEDWGLRLKREIIIGKKKWKVEPEGRLSRLTPDTLINSDLIHEEDKDKGLRNEHLLKEGK